MVNGLSSLEYEERLKTMDIFSLKYRKLRGDLIEVFKFINGQHMGYLKDMFELSTEPPLRNFDWGARRFPRGDWLSQTQVIFILSRKIRIFTL